MSVKVMGRVWEHSRQSGGALLILLALADFADDNGRSWPAVKTLAEKARMSERNARYVLRSLESSGEIATIVGGGRGGTSGYVVTVGEPAKGARVAGGQGLPGGKARRKGGSQLPKRGQPIAPEPSGTVNEPPEQQKAVPAAPPPSGLSPGDRWRPVEERIGTIFGCTTRKADGDIKAEVGRIIGALGKASADDPGMALVTLGVFEASDTWPFVTLDNFRTKFSKWVYDGRPAGSGRTNGRNPAVVATTDRTDRPLSPEEQQAARDAVYAKYPHLNRPPEDLAAGAAS
jgi:hypothetical protein